MYFDTHFPFVHKDMSLETNRRLANRGDDITVSEVVYVLAPYDMDTGEIGRF